MNAALKQNIFNMIFYSDLRGTKFILGFHNIIWAIMLTWEGNTFSLPTYNTLSAVMSEELWGIVFMLLGFIQWFLLVHNDSNSRFYIAFTGLQSAVLTYCTISLFIMMPPANAILAGEISLTLAAGWVFIMSGFPLRDRRKGYSSDRRVL